jgi:membrane-associated HD superfamily phosphohydrolase
VINAELKGTNNNFKDIVDNIPSAEATQNTKDESSSEEPVIQIDEILLTQATVNLISDLAGEQSFVMQDLRIANLKGTPSEIAQDITQRLTNHISDEVTKFATQAAKAAALAAAKAKASEKINEAIKGGAIGEKLKGLNFNLR